jgi:tRNA G18 (ribose-2'-O)-methylase SpoU
MPFQLHIHISSLLLQTNKKDMRKLKITELNRLTPEAFKDSKKIPLIVVLDHVRSLNNVGSVFRTSDAFRIEKIYLCGITATPENSLTEIHKTALGAEESVEWEYSADTVQVVQELKSKGYTIVSIEQVEGSVMLNEFKADTSAKYALILGNEVKGVQQQVVDISDISIEIPQYGTKHSLNVSVSAGIVLWEFAKQLKDIIV